MSARGMNKMLKKGETVFLGVVRRTGDIERKEKERKGKRNVGRIGAVKDLAKDGPKKDFASVAEFRQEILGKVSEEHREMLESILMEFKDVFPEHLPPGSPPKRAVELSIREQEGSSPPSRAPYRLSPQEQVELEEQIQDLLSHGFIRPSVSPIRGADFVCTKERRPMAHVRGLPRT